MEPRLDCTVRPVVVLILHAAAPQGSRAADPRPGRGAPLSGGRPAGGLAGGRRGRGGDRGRTAGRAVVRRAAGDRGDVRASAAAARPDSSCWARAASPWPGPPTCAASWRSPPGRRATPWPTTATRPTWWPSRSGRILARPAAAPRRQRPAPLARGAGRSRRARPPLQLAPGRGRGHAPRPAAARGRRESARPGRRGAAPPRPAVAATRPRRSSTSAWRRWATSWRNRRAELLVAGRVSASTLRWLERGVACRVRALVEERGLRAATRLAQAARHGAGQRPPRSVLGELLDRDGPGRAWPARRPAGRRRRHRHARPAGPSPGRRRIALAVSRGPLRLGPAAARPGSPIRGCAP